MVWGVQLQLPPLHSRVVQAYKILQSWSGSYPLRTWLQMLLLTYYPLLYLEDVAHKAFVQEDGREAGPKELVTVIVIIGPLLYMLLSRYSLLSSELWKPSKPKNIQPDRTIETEDEQPGRREEKASNDMLQTSVEKGLSEDEVIARQKMYGLNELGHRRKWMLHLWELLTGPANLLCEASTTLSPKMDI